MNRTQLNFIIDFLAFLAFCLLVATGLLVRYVLPPGTGHSLLLWGLDRHQWGDIHFWLSLTMVACMVIHLYLHWQWIVRTVKGKKESSRGFRVGLIVAMTILLLLAGIAPFLMPVEHTGKGGAEHGNQGEGSVGHGEDEAGQEKRKSGKPHISGSSTLQMICDQSGLESEALLDLLGWPVDTPLGERLGRLKQQYGFEMEEVRKAVDSLLQE